MIALAVALVAAGCGSSGTASAPSMHTAQVSGQTVALLQRLASDADELGSPDRVHHDAARDDLDNLYHSAQTVKANAEGELRATNPARPVFERLADLMATTATDLNRVPFRGGAHGPLSDLDTTLTNLAKVADDITTHVPNADLRQIDHDIATVAADVAAAR